MSNHLSSIFKTNRKRGPNFKIFKIFKIKNVTEKMVQPFPMQVKYMKKMKYISIHKNEISIYIDLYCNTY